MRSSAPLQYLDIGYQFLDIRKIEKPLAADDLDSFAAEQMNPFWVIIDLLLSF